MTRLLPLLCLLAACAHGGVPDASGGLWVVGPLGAQGRVTPRLVQGPSMSVSRSPTEVRGSVQGVAVALRLGEDRVQGQVAGRPVALTARAVEGGLEVQGLLGGQTLHVTASGATLEGRAGACNYSMRAVEGGYEGLRACGTGQEAAALTFPRDVWQSRAEQAAFLALLLTPLG